jgi:hypothetical protein
MTCCLVIVKDERRERDEEGKRGERTTRVKFLQRGESVCHLEYDGLLELSQGGCFDDGLESQSVSGQAGATAFAVIGRYPF